MCNNIICIIITTICLCHTLWFKHSRGYARPDPEKCCKEPLYKTFNRCGRRIERSDCYCMGFHAQHCSELDKYGCLIVLYVRVLLCICALLLLHIISVLYIYITITIAKTTIPPARHTSLILIINRNKEQIEIIYK